MVEGDDEVAFSCCAKAAEPIAITEKISPVENAVNIAICFAVSLQV